MGTRLRTWLCRVVPLFNRSNCFVALPQVTSDAQREEGLGQLGVVVVEIEANERTAYATWDHTVQPRSEDGGNALGIPVHLMQQLGLQKGEQVQIRVTPRAGPEAKGVFVEPASVDDSEIVEHNAARLEDLILRQLRVAYDGLVFPIIVRHGIHVLMRVQRIDAPPGTPYVILGDGSELYVKTKTRQQKPTAEEDDAAAAAAPLPAALLAAAAVEPRGDDPWDTLYVSPEMLQQKRWASGLRLPCLTFTALAGAAADALDAKSRGTSDGTPTEAALRRAVFDVVVQGAADAPPGGCLPCAGLGIARGARLLLDPSLPSSGSHGDGGGGGSARVDHADFAEKVHPLAWQEVTKALQAHTDSTPLMWRALKGPSGTPIATGMQGNTLITGAAGCGKTFLLTGLHSAVRQYVAHFDARLVLEKHAHEADGDGIPGAKKKTKTAVLLDAFRRSLTEATFNAPAVLVIDNLDVLLKGKAESKGAPTADANADMLVSMFTAACYGTGDTVPLAAQWAASATRGDSPSCRGGVTIVATAPSVEALPPACVKLFASVVKLALPNQEQRRAVLQCQLAAAGLSAERNDPNQKVSLARLSRETSNHTPRDLATLVAKAAHHARISGRPAALQKVITQDDLDAAREDYVAASLAGVKKGGEEGGAEKDAAGGKGWKTVGGMDEAKRIFNEVVILPTKYPELYKNLPIKMRSGILLYGPTGCGKSHIIRAAVEEAGVACIEVAGPELLNKYIGQSEQKVREVFERAAAAAPCVLFFDEFDSIAPQRGHDNTGVTDRVVNQLLCHLDGAEGRSGVYVVAATARPDLIDKALLRPGRLDASVFCGMPTEDERLAVLQTASRQLTLDTTVDFPELAGKTKGYTHADLAALLGTARLRCMQSIMPTSSLLASMNVDGAAAVADEVDHSNWACANATGKALDELETYVEDMGLVSQGGGSGAGGQAAAQAPKLPEVSQSILHEALQQSRPSIAPQDVERNAKRYASYQESRSSGKGEQKKGQRVTLG